MDISATLSRKWRRVLWAALVSLGLVPVPGLAAPQAAQAEVERYSREAGEALARKDLESARIALEKLALLTPQVAEVFGNGYSYVLGGSPPSVLHGRLDPDSEGSGGGHGLLFQVRQHREESSLGGERMPGRVLCRF